MLLAAFVAEATAFAAVPFIATRVAVDFLDAAERAFADFAAGDPDRAVERVGVVGRSSGSEAEVLRGTVLGVSSPREGSRRYPIGGTVETNEGMLATLARAPTATGARRAAGLRERIVERSPDHLRIDIGDPKGLLAALLAADEFDARLRDAEHVCEQEHARLVGAAAFGRNRDAQVERVTVAAGHLGAAGAGLEMDAQHDVHAARLARLAPRSRRGGRLDLEQVLGHLALL